MKLKLLEGKNNEKERAITADDPRLKVEMKMLRSKFKHLNIQKKIIDSVDKVVNTVSLKNRIQWFQPCFMGYYQQNTQEFLRYLLVGLHEDVNKVLVKPILTEITDDMNDDKRAEESWKRYLKMTTKIIDNFVGQLESTLKCSFCGYCSVTFDCFWDLSLPLPQRTGHMRLSQCMDSFTREETLDEDDMPTCSKCKERRKSTKTLSFHKFPKVLVIPLKYFRSSVCSSDKVNVIRDFPLED
ncbi:unnamed protein product [Phaedon cochleariae]|uniref:ubiquitinyl hydrolase 1 n=1 Tax=Phaedon cochleariae TaxID=80249 RepID=A0A9N9X3Y9_PHACE|nr:unnamed protein product [Phaedon cochleariae]